MGIRPVAEVRGVELTNFGPWWGLVLGSDDTNGWNRADCATGRGLFQEEAHLKGRSGRRLLRSPVPLKSQRRHVWRSVQRVASDWGELLQTSLHHTTAPSTSGTSWNAPVAQWTQAEHDAWSSSARVCTDRTDRPPRSSTPVARRNSMESSTTNCCPSASDALSRTCRSATSGGVWTFFLSNCLTITRSTSKTWFFCNSFGETQKISKPFLYINDQTIRQAG